MEEGSRQDHSGPPSLGDVTLSVDLESGPSPGGIDEWIRLKPTLYPEWKSEQEYILYYIAQAREWHGLAADAAVNRYMLTYNIIELHNYSAEVGAIVVQYCMAHPHPLRRLIGAYYKPYCTIPLYHNGIDVVIYNEAPVLEGIDNIVGLAEKYGVTIERPQMPPPPPEGCPPIRGGQGAPVGPGADCGQPPPTVAMDELVLASNEISLGLAPPTAGAAVEPPNGYGLNGKPHRDKKGD